MRNRPENVEMKKCFRETDILTECKKLESPSWVEINWFLSCEGGGIEPLFDVFSGTVCSISCSSPTTNLYPAPLSDHDGGHHHLLLTVSELGDTQLRDGLDYPLSEIGATSKMNHLQWKPSDEEKLEMSSEGQHDLYERPDHGYDREKGFLAGEDLDRERDICYRDLLKVRGQRGRWDTSARNPHYKSSYRIRWTKTTLLHPLVTTSSSSSS